MRNYRGIVMFLVAMLAAIGAVFIAAKWLQQRSAQVNQVAVAAQEIHGRAEFHGRNARTPEPGSMEVTMAACRS